MKTLCLSMPISVPAGYISVLKSVTLEGATVRRTVCQQCPPGKFANTVTNTCDDCPPGTVRILTQSCQYYHQGVQ